MTERLLINYKNLQNIPSFEKFQAFCNLVNETQVNWKWWVEYVNKSFVINQNHTKEKRFLLPPMFIILFSQWIFINEAFTIVMDSVLFYIGMSFNSSETFVTLQSYILQIIYKQRRKKKYISRRFLNHQCEC